MIEIVEKRDEDRTDKKNDVVLEEGVLTNMGDGFFEHFVLGEKRDFIISKYVHSIPKSPCFHAFNSCILSYFTTFVKLFFADA